MTDAPIGTVRDRTSRLSQLLTLLAVVVPPLGILSAAGILWGVAFTSLGAFHSSWCDR